MSSIMLTYFNHFYLYSANFDWVCLSYSKISSCILWSDKLYSALRVLNPISAVFTLLIAFCFTSTVQISSQLYESDGTAKIYTFSRYCHCTEFGFKTLSRIPKVCQVLFFKFCHSTLRMTFYVPNI